MCDSPSATYHLARALVGGCTPHEGLPRPPSCILSLTQLPPSSGISKMPPPKDHDANKQQICGVCFLKQKSVRKISKADLTNIRDKVFENYHKENWEWLPDVVCLGCHRAVFNAAANNAAGHTVNHIDYSDVRAPVTMSARSTTVESRERECMCTICWIGAMDFNKYRAFEKQMKEPVGRPRIHPEEEEAEPILVCSKCRAEIGRGKPHNNCNETGKRQNVIAVINEGDEREREQILAEQLRAVMTEKGAITCRGVPTGGVVAITTPGGRGGKLEIAAAPKNLKKPPVRFTLEAMMNGAFFKGSI